MMERRRPPRLVSGDGKLLPLVRGGSTKQVGALESSMGARAPETEALARAEHSSCGPNAACQSPLIANCSISHWPAVSHRGNWASPVAQHAAGGARWPAAHAAGRRHGWVRGKGVVQ